MPPILLNLWSPEFPLRSSQADGGSSIFILGLPAGASPLFSQLTINNDKLEISVLLRALQAESMTLPGQPRLESLVF